MLSRRKFLAAGSAAALTAGIAPTDLLDRLAVAPKPISSDQLARSTFEGLEGTPFTLRAGMIRTERLELLSVSGNDRRPNRGAVEQFSLMFRGPGAAPLQQETYRFEHDRIGSFELFIVPVGNVERGHQNYEAVFNRIYA